VALFSGSVEEAKFERCINKRNTREQHLMKRKIFTC